MRVALFVTCLVDFFRPSVGFASVELLRRGGCEVEVPAAQSCCGQPAFNNGDLDAARAVARQVIQVFAGFDYLIIPSGSCGGMVQRHYPELFADDPEWHPRALELADRAGVTRQTVGLIEAGRYNPTLNLCVQLARVTGKTLDELFWFPGD